MWVQGLDLVGTFTQYFALMNEPDVLILQLGTSFGLILRWYEREGLVLCSFQEKFGPTYCQNMWLKICGRSRSNHKMSNN